MTANRCRTFVPNGLNNDAPHLSVGMRPDDGAAFATLVRREQGAMLNVARRYVPSRAVAEEVVQETWLAVIEGIDRFEGRSSLRTWIFRILVNRAKTRGASERRSVPFSGLEGETRNAFEESLQHPAGCDSPSEGVVWHELRERVGQAMSGLTPRQRAVMSLRDIEGLTATEVCARLDLTGANQRVLLHRARCSIRRALLEYAGPEAA
jgi:RNA polymerase sigma-70 factor (ECF subfamily)